MKDFYLYFVVFIGGAAVLALEILGTRILGPFYGVSIFLWSALITVTLAALSLGYIVGGRLADRGPTTGRLIGIVSAAGIWVTLIPMIKSPFLNLAEPLGLQGAVLGAAFVLFFPPLAVLGMITPYAIRLKASRLEEVGRTVGNFSAFSTIASVLSALVTGFILIPNIGVNKLTLSIGLILLATGCLGFLLFRKAPLGGTFLVVVGVLTFWQTPVEQADPSKGLMAVEQSAYAELRVVDTKNGRHMLIDGGIHTIIDTAMRRPGLPYVWVLDIPRHFFATPGKALVVGLGGGSIVKQYRALGWEIDAVEIDPKVTQTAQRYFDLAPDDATIYHMDGRRYLQSTDKQYELIIMDAFGSSSIPFHLVTEEAFGTMASRLTPNGIAAINVETVGWNDILATSLVATLQRHFSHVVLLPIAEPPDKLGNVIILARKSEFAFITELERNFDDADYRYGPGYAKNHAWDNNFTPDIRNARVLTDDLNPVDIWAERINVEARKRLHNYFKTSPVSW